MNCNKCIHYKYPVDIKDFMGCRLWTDFKLNIKRLPIDTRCPGCGGFQPVTPDEFVSEIRKTGPKTFVVHDVLIGNITRHGGVLVSPQSKCLFYKEKR